MRVEPLRVTRRTVVALLISGLAACSSSPTAEEVLEMPNFEGAYSLTGSYDGRSGDSGVEGTLTVTDQTDDAATVTVSLRVRDNGNTSFALNFPDPDAAATSGSALADLATDGAFTVSFSGSEVISGIDPASCCNYTFAFSGRLSGDQISGRWSLTRDMPSYDSGALLATR